MKNQHFKSTWLQRVCIVIFIGFGIRLFFSCTPPDPIEINYNTLKVSGIDNSGRFMRNHTTVDTMYADAVALKLVLSDSAFYYAENLNCILESLSLSTAIAMSVDYSYIPITKVGKIKIVTMFDIDSETKAGDDISHYFSYSTGSNFELYKDSYQAISELNGIQGNQSASVDMVLKKTIKNTKAQFKISISLDNNQELSFVSDTLTIISD